MGTYKHIVVWWHHGPVDLTVCVCVYSFCHIIHMTLSRKPKGFKIKPRKLIDGKWKNKLVKKIQPGRTIWKRPAFKKPASKRSAVAKRPSGATGKKKVRNPRKDKRANSRWLWAAVECGEKRGIKKSHTDGTKRVAMALLPRKVDAPQGMPRGAVSLTQIMAKHIKPGSRLVADEWTATPKAARNNNLPMEGTVNHSNNWRNPSTGVHSNDAESEFARLKLFLKCKYSYVRSSNNKNALKKDRTLELNIAEYLFYTNVGRDMSSIMKALRHYWGIQ